MVMKLRVPGSRTFWIGLACGVALVFAGRLAVNETTIPDLIVAPLLMADSAADADAIVVLGAGLIGDCIPNLNAMRRVVRGTRLFKDGRAPLMAIVGGTGGGTCPVATAMAAFARELGVEPSRILIETRSRNTWENAVNAAPLLRDRGVERILLVTDRLHMRRASGVFEQYGFVVQPSAVPIYEGHPDNVSMLVAGAREAVALAYYAVRGWGTSDAQPNPPTRVSGESRGTGESMTAVPSRAGVGRISFQDGADRSRRSVVILGASYAAGWKLPDVDGKPVINAGIPGEQSHEMLQRFSRDVAAVSPRAVVLWGFINDIYRADDMEKSLARIRESYLELIRLARDEGIEPILATEVTVRAPKTVIDTLKATAGRILGRESYQDRVNAHVVGVNQWLRDLAARDNLLLLDLQRTLADGDGPRLWAYAVQDGSHISEDGYRALTDYAVPILTSHLAPRSSAVLRR